MRTIIHIEIVEDVDRAIRMVETVAEAMKSARKGERRAYTTLTKDGAVWISRHGTLDEILGTESLDPMNLDPTRPRA